MPNLQPYDLCRAAIELANGTRDAAIELCGLLDRIYEEKAYTNEHHGDEAVFLDELGLSEGTVSKYRTIGRAMRVFAIPKSRFLESKSLESAYIAARSKTKEEAEDLLDKAAVLTYRDLKLVASNADSCAHDWEVLTLRKCRTCKAVENSFDAHANEQEEQNR